MRPFGALLFSAILTVPMIAMSSEPQLWFNEDFVKKHGDDAIVVSEENRFGVKDDEHLDEIHITPSYTCRLCRYASIGVNYRHVFMRTSHYGYSDDYRPGIDFTVMKSNLMGVDLSNRSRFIYRKPENENGYFRYRNLSTITTAKTYTSMELKPFASYEWYFDEGSSDRHFDKNDKFFLQWITIGVSFELTELSRLSLWYRHVDNKDNGDGTWTSSNVIGLSLKVEI